jgi:hypothetical protein
MIMPDGSRVRVGTFKHSETASRVGALLESHGFDEASKAETWGEMTTRHAMEKAEALTALREAGLTQTQAASKLGIPLSHLNSFIIRNSIPWTESKQGRASA